MNKKLLYEKYMKKPQVSETIKENKQLTTDVVITEQEKTVQEKTMDEFRRLFGI